MGKVRKQAKTATGNVRTFGGIQYKIYLCFVFPIAFMIVLGMISYRETKEGMHDICVDMTQQTLHMASEYMQSNASVIEAEVLKYVSDSSIAKYVTGIYQDQPLETRQLIENQRSAMLAAQVGNDFISNIYCIPESDFQMITTVGQGHGQAQAGYYTQYMEEMSYEQASLSRWIDRHDGLDSYLGIDSSSYLLACQKQFMKGNAVVVIDVKTESIATFLENLDFGEGSIVGLVTDGGRELCIKKNLDGSSERMDHTQMVFLNQEYYEQAKEDMIGEEIIYDGESYLFFKEIDSEINASICAMIPMELVTERSASIKMLCLLGVLISGLIAAIFGSWIASGIKKNMKIFRKGLTKVSEGNLVTVVNAKGHDEFQGLAQSVNHMITNHRNLVNKVNRATKTLEKSFVEVDQVSESIQTCSLEIGAAIHEINEFMEQQSVNATDCVGKTDTLSMEIQQIEAIAATVEEEVRTTEQLITDGKELIHLLGERAKETNAVTSDMRNNIEDLQRQFQQINQFAATISDIYEQTNLLSLNASIEAARAGSAGSGFSVVAQEIRVLADHSNEAANEIRKNVDHISIQTMESVKEMVNVEEIVTLQSEIVQQVIQVFEHIFTSIEKLYEGILGIHDSTRLAGQIREDTLSAVKNISILIGQTAANTEVVDATVSNLQKNVTNLNDTAKVLGENMKGLKNEISVFQTQ